MTKAQCLSLPKTLVLSLAHSPRRQQRQETHASVKRNTPAIHKKLALMVDWWHQADNCHAGPDQPPQEAMLVHAGLASAKICRDAEIPALKPISAAVSSKKWCTGLEVIQVSTIPSYCLDSAFKTLVNAYKRVSCSGNSKA